MARARLMEIDEALDGGREPGLSELVGMQRDLERMITDPVYGAEARDTLRRVEGLITERERDAHDRAWVMSDDQPNDKKRAVDDLAKYREAMALLEQIAPMADKLNRMGVDPNAHLWRAVDALGETVAAIVEKLREDATDENARERERGMRELYDSGGGGVAYSDRRPLTAKAGGAHGVYR